MAQLRNAPAGSVGRGGRRGPVRGGTPSVDEEEEDEEEEEEDEEEEDDEEEDVEEEEDEEEGEDGGSGGGGGGSKVTPGVELKKQIDAVRIIVVTTTGTMCSDTMPVNRAEADPDGWVRVVMPFSEAAVAGDVASGKMTELAITADGYHFFYVGRVRMLQEDQPLLADAGENKIVRVGETVTFKAAPQPYGETGIRYGWDFSQADELREDGLGQTTQYRFDYPGHYIVTLMVSDLQGKRVPKRDTISVVVR